MILYNIIYDIRSYVLDAAVIVNCNDNFIMVISVDVSVL